jgi:hypothetical protein
MSRYAAARTYLLPESLGDLAGPTSGTVALPWYIDWGPHYEYDLADEADLVLMYERAIREAQSPADLSSYLSADLLRRHWTNLFLPSAVRVAWQTRSPRTGTDGGGNVVEELHRGECQTRGRRDGRATTSMCRGSPV